MKTNSENYTQGNEILRVLKNPDILQYSAIQVPNFTAMSEISLLHLIFKSFNY